MTRAAKGKDPYEMKCTNVIRIGFREKSQRVQEIAFERKERNGSHFFCDRGYEIIAHPMKMGTYRADNHHCHASFTV